MGENTKDPIRAWWKFHYRHDWSRSKWPSSRCLLPYITRMSPFPQIALACHTQLADKSVLFDTSIDITRLGMKNWSKFQTSALQCKLKTRLREQTQHSVTKTSIIDVFSSLSALKRRRSLNSSKAIHQKRKSKWKSWRKSSIRGGNLTWGVILEIYRSPLELAPFLTVFA